MIRNYLGFARGIGGAELARQAYEQAWIFGARFLAGREVVRLRLWRRHPRRHDRRRHRDQLAHGHPRGWCQRTTAWTSPPSSGSSARASTTGHLPPRPGTSPVGTSTWSEPATLPGRPSSTWRGGPRRPPSSCAARVSRRACRGTSSTRSRRPRTSSVLLDDPSRRRVREWAARDPHPRGRCLGRHIRRSRRRPVRPHRSAAAHRVAAVRDRPRRPRIRRHRSRADPRRTARRLASAPLAAHVRDECSRCLRRRRRTLAFDEACCVGGRRGIGRDQADPPLSRVTGQVVGAASQPDMIRSAREAAAWRG